MYERMKPTDLLLDFLPVRNEPCFYDNKYVRKIAMIRGAFIKGDKNLKFIRVNNGYQKNYIYALLYDEFGLRYQTIVKGVFTEQTNVAGYVIQHKLVLKISDYFEANLSEYETIFITRVGYDEETKKIVLFENLANDIFPIYECENLFDFVP